MKPNFDSMTRQEIRDYILQHQEDDDAIEAALPPIWGKWGKM